MISSISNSKRLAAKLAFWLLIFVLANSVASGPVSRLVEKPVQILKQRIEQSRARLILLGDSHTQALGQAGGKILNLASGGDSFFEMRAKLRYCLLNGMRPQLVVIQVDSHGFSTARAVRNNRQQGEMLSGSIDDTEVYGTHWKRRWLWTPFPLTNPVNARLARRYLLYQFFQLGDELGSWETMTQVQRMRLRNKRFRVSFSGQFDPGLAFQLSALLKDCEEYDIPVLGLRCPLDPDYLHLVEESVEHSEAEVYVDNLGIDVLDYSSKVTDLGQFANQDHLRRGSDVANKLCERLLQRLSVSEGER